VDLAFSALLESEDSAVLAVLEDLTTYPRWLGVVQSVRADGDAAWSVDLGARLGFLKGTKRVRMVRVPAGEGEVRFERDEADGEDHPPWVLHASVHDGTLNVDLTYGGSSALVTLLEPVLRAEAAKAPARLERLLKAP
jgi:hypothetical protein